MKRESKQEMDSASGLAASLSVRVYYEDTDAGGVVYYANYLRFAERARTEWLRQMGWTHAELLRDYNLLFVVRHVEADYIASARLDDLLVIETELGAVGASRLDMRQDIRQDKAGSGDGAATLEDGAADAGRLLATVKVTLVAISPEGKVLRLPAAMRDKLRGAEAAGDRQEGR